EKALELLEESCSLAKSINATRVMPGLLAAVGAVLWRIGESKRSQSVLNEALTMTRANANRYWEPVILNNLGFLAIAKGELDAARRCLEQSFLITGPDGNRREIALTAEAMAHLEMQAGDLGRAVLFFSVADKIRKTIGCPLPPCDQARHALAI